MAPATRSSVKSKTCERFSPSRATEPILSDTRAAPSTASWPPMRAPLLSSLVLYEPPLHFERLDPSLIDRVQVALDAGDPDGALEILFPAIGVTDTEAYVLRSVESVWKRLRQGVRLVPRELRTGFQAIDRLNPLDPPDIPTLYLYGEKTDASVFPTADEVAELLPRAQLHRLPGQRHLAFGFDPTPFAQAILQFTTGHDR